MASDPDQLKAQEIVTQNRISKLYHDEIPMDDIFLVTGKSSEYIVVYPNYCSCTHFIVTCIKTKSKVCKHILAVGLCNINNG